MSVSPAGDAKVDERGDGENDCKWQHRRSKICSDISIEDSLAHLLAGFAVANGAGGCERGGEAENHQLKEETPHDRESE
jgi:hypothetical protein